MAESGILRWHEDPRFAVRWVPVPGRRDHYVALRDGVELGEIFKGKSGWWYAVTDNGVARDRKQYWVEMIVSGVWFRT